MSYLLDKKVQRKKNLQIALGVVFFIILFYFRAGVFSGFSYITEGIFHPVLVAGNNIGDKFKSFGSYFLSKSSLFQENQSLKAELAEDDMRMANYNSVVADRDSLQEILNRKNTKVPMLVSAILAKPNQSIYDTLLIDAGVSQEIKVGDMVFALGDVPIGRVSDVYSNSSKVILFSSSGEKTEGVVGKGVFMELLGRGGGNFEMIMPKDFVLQKGDQVSLPGMNSSVLAIAETIISDPRDPFTKALLVSPVNVQEIKFVEVKTSP